jgi:hypothetical protein
VAEHEYEAACAKYRALAAEVAGLHVVAPMGGKVVGVVDDLRPGLAAWAWRSILAVAVRESGA